VELCCWQWAERQQLSVGLAGGKLTIRKRGWTTMLILLIVLLLVFGFGGGYYGHSRWGYGGGAGTGLGTVLLILLIAYMLGMFH
jgi:uncharacterized spore protein YtfJ